MIALINKELQSEAAKNKLVELQNKLDLISEIAEKITESENLWKNKISNKEFKEIRKELAQMSFGNNRCCYCEDALAYTIEHFYPKAVYPEKTFIWDNYLYICGECNSNKNAKFPIFINEEKTHINFATVDNKNESYVLLNPRFDNPLNFIWLDLETFVFVADELDNQTTRYLRASNTLEVLNLDSEERAETLRNQRRIAFKNYANMVEVYKTHKEKCETKVEIDANEQEFKNYIQEMSHPTVWEEMKRQCKFYPFLQKLFEDCKEVLAW
jgi:uncharacterized protein (TIGR02646 family)